MYQLRTKKPQKIRESSGYFTRTPGEKVFSVFNNIILLLLGVLTLFPFYVIVIQSISPPMDYYIKRVIFWPSEVTLDYYKFILGGASTFLQAFKNSLFMVTVGTVMNMFFTFLASYVLSQKRLPFRNQITFYMVIPMFFSGGMVPGYLMMQALGLLDSLPGLLISGLVSISNILFLRNFLMTIPVDLIESAHVDGCPEWKVLYKVILPLSLPAIATFTLFYAVSQWNHFSGARIFIKSVSKQPLQVYVQSIINQATAIRGDDRQTEKIYSTGFTPPPITFQATSIVCSTLPIILVYPFVQKYFVKGLMMGSLKG